MFLDIGGVQSCAEIIATLILLVVVLMNKRLDSVPMAISITFLAIGSLVTVYQNVSRGGLSVYSGSLTSLLVQLLSVPIAVVYWRLALKKVKNLSSAVFMLLVMLSIQGLSALRKVLLAYRARLFQAYGYEFGAVLLMDCVVYAAFIVTLLFWVGHLMKKSGKAAKKN